MVGAMQETTERSEYGAIQLIQYGQHYWTAILIPAGPMASGETKEEAASRVKRLAAQALAEQRAEEQTAT